ncbi:hypothetical protein [Burkholderia stabilis]|uniref:hypothetical protein n=1 Tax=Burkholderia stabilis TaxID=95485 RepID=UPI0013E90EB0|nr:hypothetical protein [Burkholderia stabilis]
MESRFSMRPIVAAIMYHGPHCVAARIDSNGIDMRRTPSIAAHESPRIRYLRIL